MWKGGDTPRRFPTVTYTRTTHGYLGGYDTSMDVTGQGRGHLQRQHRPVDHRGPLVALIR
eukprot:4500799-Pyramimonas_sp.AAC.1